MYAKKALVLVLALLIVNDVSAQSFQYDTQGRLVSDQTKYDPKGRLMMSGDKVYHLPQLRATDYHFGNLTYKIKTSKIKSVRALDYPPYANIHQEPIKLYGGLYYLNAREYMPSIKRFVSMDSWDVGNRYQYAKGNPVRYNDPSGHLPKILEWFIPTTPAEGFALIVGMLLGGMGEWFFITKLIPGKGKLATLAISGLFNGTVNAGAGYLGNGITSGNWHDLRRVGTDFGIGLVQGLIIGNIAYERGENDIKLKTKKIRKEFRKNKKRWNRQSMKLIKTDTVFPNNIIIKEYKIPGIMETQKVIDKTEYFFKTQEITSSIDYNKHYPSLIESRSLKDNITSINHIPVNIINESKFNNNKFFVSFSKKEFN